jgi:hypothetical protein
VAVFKDDLEPDIEKVFINKDEFAEEVTYQPAGGGSFLLSAIFDREHQEITDLGTEAQITSAHPMLTIQESKLPPASLPPAAGDTVIVRTKTYTVIRPRTDGTGIIFLDLHEG